jgi:hypothetical protein
MERESSLVHSQVLATCPSPEPWYVFTVRSCKHLDQPANWRTTPCRLSATAYSIYSQLPSILEAVLPSATRRRAVPWWQGPTYKGIINTVVQNLFSWTTKHLGFAHHCIRDLRALLQVLVELLVSSMKSRRNAFTPNS